MRLRDYSLAVEGRADLPTATEGATGGAIGVRASLVTGSLLPCWHLGNLHFCGVLAVGGLFSSSFNIPAPVTRQTLFASLGARAGYELPIYGALAIRVHADLGIPLVHSDLQIDNSTRWSTPPVSVTLGAAVAG